MAGAGGGHRRDQKAVPHTVFGEVSFHSLPVISTNFWDVVPEIKLQESLGSGRPSISRVRALFFGDLDGLGYSSVIYRFEDPLIKLCSFLGLKADAHDLEDVGQALHSDANRSMSEVGSLCFFNWVKVLVNDLIEIPSTNSSDVDKLVTFECESLFVHECREGKGGEVADCHLVWRGEFDDFSAQVAGFYGSKVLLVGLPVASVLVEHIWSSRLDLRVDDCLPELSCLEGPSSFAFPLILGVQLFELFAPNFRQSGTLIRAHERPQLILDDPLHEEVRDP